MAQVGVCGRFALRGSELRLRAVARRAAVATDEADGLQVTFGFRSTSADTESCGTTSIRLRRTRGGLVAIR